ncbi:C40 family peptidase [Acinetobacter soli]|uniref:C40 family peptidase n=1 Tax=Acinetobacter soli TaxID=487316 RepID=UPI00125090BC|nr:Mov34/MPN/PAD-1 family protein [Acinetobacter soli]
MKLTARIKKQILTAASEAYPDEMCGVIVDQELIRLKNVAQNPRLNFEIDSMELARIEDQAEIQAYVHSHPDGTTMASALDRHQIELHQKPWLICSYPEFSIAKYEPCGFKAPLIGRSYFHGWQDCYTLVQDFYSRELDISLRDFEREDNWWENEVHASLYIANFKSAGFYQVSKPRYGDMLVCKVGRTVHPNHALIWLGDRWQLKSEQVDPAIGSTLILHHPYGHSSKREIYGPNWQERTVLILRHEEMKDVF